MSSEYPPEIDDIMDTPDADQKEFYFPRSQRRGKINTKVLAPRQRSKAAIRAKRKAERRNKKGGRR